MSIYGPNFTTPESRAPYYIKIRRCVIDEYVLTGIDTSCWSVPKQNSREEIEIVVPDINNNTKFYKYVVYNDTACECERGDSALRVSQHENLSVPREGIAYNNHIVSHIPSLANYHRMKHPHYNVYKRSQ